MSQQAFQSLNQFVIDVCETVTQYKLQSIDPKYRPKVISKSIEAYVDFAYRFFLANYSQTFADEFLNDVKRQGFAKVFGMYKYRSGIEYSFKIFKNQMYQFYN